MDEHSVTVLQYFQVHRLDYTQTIHRQTVMTFRGSEVVRTVLLYNCLFIIFSQKHTSRKCTVLTFEAMHPDCLFRRLQKWISITRFHLFRSEWYQLSVKRRLIPSNLFQNSLNRYSSFIIPSKHKKSDINRWGENVSVIKECTRLRTPYRNLLRVTIVKCYKLRRP